MAVYVVTGKLGAGKTLAAVSRIQHYLKNNKRCASNLDLRLEKLINPWSKNARCYRLPDIPLVSDLDAIGLGYDGEFKGDDHNGLICLDECAKWLNSRSWNDPERKKLVDWMIHARKRRWDVLFIIQDISAMDKQFRDLFAEHVVYCRRFDRLSIPFITSFSKLFFEGGIRSARLHVGIVKYGDQEGSAIVDRWWYRGNDLFDAFDTEQAFSDKTCSLNTLLPPNTVYGRYYTKWMKFKDDYKTVKTRTFLIAGTVFGLFVASFLEATPFSPDRGTFSCSEQWEEYIGCDVSVSQLELIMKKYKKGSVASANGDLSPDADAKGPLYGVYITASVKRSNGFDYVFYDANEQEWFPHNFGYRARWVDECTAKLVGKNDVHLITCNSGNQLASNY